MLVQHQEAYQQECEGKLGQVTDVKCKRDDSAGNQRDERRLAKESSQNQPNRDKKPRILPREGGKQAAISSCALASIEAKPNGKNVPEQGTCAGDGAGFPAIASRQQRRQGALERIKEKGGCRKALAARPKDVRRADIARAELAYVAQPGRLRQKKAKWDGAAKIARE